MAEEQVKNKKIQRFEKHILIENIQSDKDGGSVVSEKIF